ncbi:MAG: hypothetical protein LBF72_02275 [Holosporales bacterium]|nr:hypothetical protein [Holosporales bacterium]
MQRVLQVGVPADSAPLVAMLAVAIDVNYNFGRLSHLAAQYLDIQKGKKVDKKNKEYSVASFIVDKEAPQHIVGMMRLVISTPELAEMLTSTADSFNETIYFKFDPHRALVIAIMEHRVSTLFLECAAILSSRCKELDLAQKFIDMATQRGVSSRNHLEILSPYCPEAKILLAGPSELALVQTQYRNALDKDVGFNTIPHVPCLSSMLRTAQLNRFFVPGESSLLLREGAQEAGIVYPSGIAQQLCFETSAWWLSQQNDPALQEFALRLMLVGAPHSTRLRREHALLLLTLGRPSEISPEALEWLFYQAQEGDVLSLDVLAEFAFVTHHTISCDIATRFREVISRHKVICPPKILIVAGHCFGCGRLEIRNLPFAIECLCLAWSKSPSVMVGLSLAELSITNGDRSGLDIVTRYADERDPTAQSMLGSLYFYGDQRIQFLSNPPEAFRLLSESAEQGDKEAVLLLGLSLAFGYGTSVDITSAINRLQQLTVDMTEPEQPDMSQSEIEAITETSDPESLLRYGVMLRRQGDTRALQFIVQSVSRGCPDAIVIISDFLLMGVEQWMAGGCPDFSRDGNTILSNLGNDHDQPLEYEQLMRYLAQVGSSFRTETPPANVVSIALYLYFYAACQHKLTAIKRIIAFLRIIQAPAPPGGYSSNRAEAMFHSVIERIGRDGTRSRFLSMVSASLRPR